MRPWRGPGEASVMLSPVITDIIIIIIMISLTSRGLRVMLGPSSQPSSDSPPASSSLVTADLSLTTPTARTVMRSPMLTITTTTTALPEKVSKGQISVGCSRQKIFWRIKFSLLCVGRKRTEQTKNNWLPTKYKICCRFSSVSKAYSNLWKGEKKWSGEYFFLERKDHHTLSLYSLSLPCSIPGAAA